MNTFMSSQSERQHIQALVTCNQIGGLTSLFNKTLEETKTALMHADDPIVISRLQGRARCLADFLEALNQASSVLERLK